MFRSSCLDQGDLFFEVEVDISARDAVEPNNGALVVLGRDNLVPEGLGRVVAGGVRVA